MRDERCDLSYWFPILAATGARVPATTIVRTAIPLENLCEGELVPGLDGFLAELRAACDRHGYPCFLRTGQTSGKHSWADTCFVASADDIPGHVEALVEFSMMADLLGLPCETWAVREFLRLDARFTAFGGMPVAREFRCFFRDNAVLCIHPYWPPGSIVEPSEPDWTARLEALNSLSADDVSALESIVARVAPAFDGGWSLDIAQAVDGTWYCIDMAEMDRSFHWSGCPNGPPDEPDPPTFFDAWE